MKITIDISREYALVLLDHVKEDAEFCDDPNDRAECEALADELHSLLNKPGPRPSLEKVLNPKPF